LGQWGSVKLAQIMLHNGIHVQETDQHVEDSQHGHLVVVNLL